MAVGLLTMAAVAVGLTLVTSSGPGGADRTPAQSAPDQDAGDVRELTADQPDQDATPSLSFSATGLAGGGFQNVVAFAPDGSAALLGGDNAGLHRSTDAGLTWLPVGAGLPDWAAKVAAIAWHPDDPDVVIAVGGFSGTTGGVLRSEDGGRTWVVASEDVRFSGANTPGVAGLPRTHPRATGDLLLWQDGVLYAATFDAGVHRSTDGGRTWQSLGVEGHFLRGLTMDGGGRLLVATRDASLWAVTDRAGAATAEQVPGGPTTVEELAVDGDTVLAAAGAQGIWTLRDGTWQQVHRVQAAVTTVEVAGDGTWWAGTHDPAGDAPGVLVSIDRGATWAASATGEALEPVVAGTGLDWWVARAQRSFLPDGRGWTAAQFAHDPTDPGTVLLAGRAGAWRTSDGGATWQAAVAGLGATAHDQTAVAPDGRIATANTDHRLLVSDDGLRTVTAVEPGATKGTAVAVDTTAEPGTVLVATAERDANTDGELYRVNPGSTEFEALGLGDATGGQRVLAIATGHDDRDRPIILAAVEQGGLWRLRDQTWSRAPTEAFRGRQSTPDAHLLWPDPGRVVLALDRTTGLWRSTDAGSTWALLEPLEVPTDRNDPAGFLAPDGADGDHAWLTTTTQVLRIDGLAGEVVLRPVAGVQRPGPVVGLPDGGALVVTRDDLGVPPQLLHVCGDEVTTVATGARFRGGATDATDLDLDADGHLLVTTTTNGLLRSAVPVADAVACDVTVTP